ncbi:MAG: hypothetical protein IJX63_14105 [Lachnospiraceae bacterium]|nr:hypothetical protein [Lachnospiraceae bacterium]
MVPIFEQEKFAAIGMLVCFFLSLFIRLLLSLLYQRMIAETDNMATTKNKLLKQCKLKFTNCYQLNNGVSNVPIFVEKFLNRLSFGPFSFSILYHLSGQLMLLSIVFSGMGVCRSIIAGNMFGEILPFYICSLVELYLFLSLSTLLDIKGKRKALKVNLVDYLENHLSNRMQVTRVDMQMLYGKEKKQSSLQRNLEILPIAGWLADKDTKEIERDWLDVDDLAEPYPEMPGHAVTLNPQASTVMEAEEAEALEELLKEFLSLS